MATKVAKVNSHSSPSFSLINTVLTPETKFYFLGSPLSDASPIDARSLGVVILRHRRRRPALLFQERRRRDELSNLDRIAVPPLLRRMRSERECGIVMRTRGPILKRCWKKQRGLGCVNSSPAARGSQEAGFAQPRAHSFAPLCILANGNGHSWPMASF